MLRSLPTRPALSAASLENLTEILVRESGMVSLRGRPEDVQWAVAERAAARQPAVDLPAYVELVGRDRAELEGLLELLTIGETFFFRHPEVFSALTEHAFPEFAGQPTAPRFWSAACSIGCEAYTLAMAWEEFSGESAGGLTPEILGTDLNVRFLEQARRGDYGAWSLRNLAAGRVERFFTRHEDRFQVRDRFRRAARFERLNLVPFAETPDLVAGGFDLILCRNVMIYFSPETNARLAEAFFDRLRPGGWFVTGASECNVEIFARYEAITAGGAILYRRPQETATPTPVFRPSTPARRSRLPPPKPAAAATTPGFAELASRRRWTETLAAAERALVLDSLDAEAHFFAGLAHAALGQPNAAIDSLRRCLYLRRDHVGAHLNLALLFSGAGQSRSATRHARLALKSPLRAETPIPTPNGPVAVEALPTRLEPIINSSQEDPS